MKARLTRTLIPKALPLVVAFLVLAGCDGGNPSPTPQPPTPTAGITDIIGGMVTVTPQPSPTGLSEADRVAVYAGAFASNIERDGVTRFYYISPYIGQGERLDNPDPNTPVPPTLVEALESRFGDQRFEVTEFLDALKDGDLESGGQVRNDGLFVTLGPIVNDPADQNMVSVQVAFYRMVGDARGDIYRFRRDGTAEGGWQLLDFGEEWNYKTTDPEVTVEPAP
jgi:hypothetical protein